jgi:hypothetical protein
MEKQTCANYYPYSSMLVDCGILTILAMARESETVCWSFIDTCFLHLLPAYSFLLVRRHIGFTLSYPSPG